jgi:acyl-CoA thioester hydrolase
MVAAGTGRPVRIGEREREAWAPYLEDPVAFSRR